MTKIAILILCCISVSCYAQTNLSFKRWTDKFGVQEPEGWVTQNFLSVAGADSISFIPSNNVALLIKV